MGTQGLARVRPVHSVSLVKKYRRLLGEQKFWDARSTHPRAAAELARLNSAIDALANALPFVAPGIALVKLKPVLFHPSAPLPGHALTRAVLAGLRILKEPTLETLTSHITVAHGVDIGLHDIGILSQRIKKVLDGFSARSSIATTQGNYRLRT